MDTGSETLTWEWPRRVRRRPGHAQPQLVLVINGSHPQHHSVRFFLDQGAEVWVSRSRVGEQRVVRQSERRRIEVADQAISAEHAVVAGSRGKWYVEDLGSAGGTFVNGVPVQRGTLDDGDVIAMGNTAFVFRAEGPGARPVEGAVDPSEASSISSTFNPWLERQFDELRRIAVRKVPVLVLGDSGTGKEHAARAIHRLSARPGRFVAINCGALPATLVESELFGRHRGAYSDATAASGLVRAADGGTLFLDEIAELRPASQAALLRVLQEGEVWPLGATRPVNVDIRVISATHQNLPVRIAEGRFRPDLFARIAGFTLRLPPLRERREDLGELMRGHLRSIATGGEDRVRFTSQAVRALLHYDYPMNIRELEHLLRSAVALAAGGAIELGHLPLELRGQTSGLMLPLTDDERLLRASLERLLRQHAGNVSAVARALGKAPVQVRRWCRRFALDLSAFRAGHRGLANG